MHVTAIVSTKGGVGKTTTAANLGGLAADAGLRVLLLDLDVQPTLSSYYTLPHRAPAGRYELLAYNESSRSQLICRTAIEGLDLVVSNDAQGQLNTLLLHAPDRRLRLRNLLQLFRPHYDLLLIDTQGARSVLLEMAILASDLLVSPVTPEILGGGNRLTPLNLAQDFQHMLTRHLDDRQVTQPGQDVLGKVPLDLLQRTLPPPLEAQRPEGAPAVKDGMKGVFGLRTGSNWRGDQYPVRPVHAPGPEPPCPP